MARSAAVDTDNGLARCDHLRSLSVVRVVAGDLRGRRIESPTGDATRPTTDKVREAVFNALGSLDLVDGARVLDLFAGSGAGAIEALSPAKQRRMAMLAEAYSAEHPELPDTLRVDLVAIDLDASGALESIVHVPNVVEG